MSAPAGGATAPRIRDAAPADVPRILEVVEAAYRGRGGWTTEEGLVSGNRTDEAEVSGLLEDPAVTVLVAEDATGRVIGTCYTSRAGTRAEFGLFAVDPAAQAGGIGKALVEAQASRLAADGVLELELHVLQGRDELNAWYQRRGFVPTGATLPFPGDPANLADPSARFDVLVRALNVH